MALHVTFSLAMVAVPASFLFYVACRMLYNLFLHPLRTYPGPLVARATILAMQKHILDGSFPFWLHELHQKYGLAIRYAPNEISIIETEVWKDVYGHRGSAFKKQWEFYGPDAYGNPPGLIRANNVDHARQRRLVSHAFSDKALRDQEELLKVYAALLVKQLKQAVAKDCKADMVSWYNWTTFDIMADLTFGEPLHLLQDSQYTPWVQSIFGSIKMIALTMVVRSWKLLDSVMQRYIPEKLKQQRRTHMAHSSDRITKRLARKTDRPDIWTFITRYSGTEDAEGKGLLPTEMHSNGALFMLAGTETTATELSGMTYYLLKNPTKLQRLQKEIRGAFSSLDDLNMTQLAQLEYLNACIEEGLRIYPPVAINVPRTAPKGGAQVGQRYIPGGATVGLAHYAAYHSPSHFKDPDFFVPERWLPEGQRLYGTDRKEIFNPFSHGPRNCVGKNLAYHEMRLVFASVVLNFDMEFLTESEGWPVQQNYILWDKGPLMVKLKPVTN